MRTLTFLGAALLLAFPAALNAAKASSANEQHIYIHVSSENAGTPVKVIVDQPEAKQAVSKAEDASMSCCETAPAAETPAIPKNSQMGLLFFVFVLACFAGFELISKVPSQLHTPLMSGSNAISGITIVGAIIAAGMGHSKVTVLLGALAVAFAMINVVGGYMVTDRMLGMFRQKGGKQ